MPGDGDFGMAFVGMDLAFDRMDVFDGGVVEIFAPDEGFERLQEMCTGLRVASTAARFYHGGTFPVLAHGFVIGLCRIGGDGDLGSTSVGAQAEVYAEDITVGGDFAEQFDQRLHDVDGRSTYVIALAKGEFLGVIKNNQVDIAGVVQLESAVLAHGEDHKAGGGFELFGIAFGEILAGRDLPQDEPQRAPDRCVGKMGKSSGHLHHVPESADVCQRDGERGPAFGFA